VSKAIDTIAKLERVATDGAGDGGANMSSTGGTETRPRNVALLACIKT
jgi:hypothetical protein